MLATPLPFADFLLALRARGLAVGLREHEHLGRLLCRWQGRDVHDLAVAVAALLGRSPEESAEFEALFISHYTAVTHRPEAERPGSLNQPGRGVVPRWQRWVRRGLSVAGVLWTVGFLLAVVFGVWPMWRRVNPSHTDPQTVKFPEGVLCTSDTCPPGQSCDPATRTCRHPESPPAAFHAPPLLLLHHRLPVVLWTLPGPLMLLALFGIVRLRQRGRAWALAAGREVLQQWPGPARYELVLRDLAPPLPRDNLDDMATVLGRRGGGLGVGHELDAEWTVAETVRLGGMPNLRFRARPPVAPLLVLHDISPGMRPFARKVEALLLGLSRRGVALERWYFEEDASFVSRTPDGAPLALAELARRAGDSPLLVLSAGQGALASGPGIAPPGWVAGLARWRMRTWLHPVADPALWARALWRLPVRVWPMTLDGMLGAAYELSVGEERRLHVAAWRLQRRRPLRGADVGRMKRLVALLPEPTLELVELLRQRFYPEIPEEVSLALLSASTSAGGLHLPRAEAEALLATHPLEGEVSQSEVRRYLLKVLADSEPAAGSLAHLRWRLDRAVQTLQAAGSEVPQQTVAEIAELAGGPLFEEAHDALARLGVPGAKVPRGEAVAPVERRLALALSGAAPRPGGGMGGMGWGLPALRDMALALLLGVLVFAGLDWAGVGVAVVPNEEGRYHLVWKPWTSIGQEGGTLQLTSIWIPPGGGPLFPGPRDLYQDGQPFGHLLKTISDETWRQGATHIGLPAEGLGHWYQIRVRLPRGNLALSNPVWVPGKRPVGRLVVYFSARLGGSLGAVPFWLQWQGVGDRTTGVGDKEQELPAGTWALSADVPGYDAVSRKIAVIAGQRREEKIELTDRIFPAAVDLGMVQRDMTTRTRFDLDRTPVTNVAFAEWLNQVPGRSPIDVFQAVRVQGRLIVELNTHDGGLAWDAAQQRFTVRVGAAERPVFAVTWHGATAYCHAQGKRLPTEAELQTAPPHASWAAQGEEWTADRSSAATGSEDPARHVVLVRTADGRVASRRGVKEDRAFDLLGFRCVRDLSSPDHPGRSP